jgi:hypothetical protein
MTLPKQAMKPAQEFPPTPLDRYIDALCTIWMVPRNLAAQSVLAMASFAVQHQGEIDISFLANQPTTLPLGNLFLSVVCDIERKKEVDRRMMEGAKAESLWENKSFRVLHNVIPSEVHQILHSKQHSSYFLAQDEDLVLRGCVESRGLSSLLWKVYNRKPPFESVGISAHLIAPPDENIYARQGNLEMSRLFQRGLLLPIMPESMVGKRIKKKCSDLEHQEIVKASVQSLDDFALLVESCLSTPQSKRCLSLSDWAQSVLMGFRRRCDAFDDHPVYTKTFFGDMAPLHAVRLASTLALFENNRADTVTEEHVVNAIALVEFYHSEMERIALHWGMVA